MVLWLTPYTVVVASAGNDYRRDDYAVYPAMLNGVTCVSAYDQIGSIPVYANYPSWTALLAPTDTWTTDMWGISPKGYVLGFASNPVWYSINFAGTSASASHVSAVAAMIASAHRSWTPQQIQSALRSSALHDLPNDYRHVGRLNAFGALSGQ
jgi:serine protease